MEDISLFSTSAVFEELELFNPLPAIEEDGFLDEYDVYSFIEDPGVKPPPNLLAEDLLQEFEIEGKNLFLKTVFWAIVRIYLRLSSLLRFVLKLICLPSVKALKRPLFPPPPPPHIITRTQYKQIMRNVVS